jgi:DNA repair protein RadC
MLADARESAQSVQQLGEERDDGGEGSVTPISAWPLFERPRERLLDQGAATMGEAELFALVLGSSTRGSGGVLETSREILRRFGGLPGLARASPRELMQIAGIGTARACAIAAVVELGRRLAGAAHDRGEPLVCAEDVFRRLQARFVPMEQEVFLVLSLDAKHRMISVRQVAQGSATSVEVHPREAFRPAIREGAAAVIFVHNHPSGDPEPSLQDRELTSRLKQAGELLGIPVLDHVILGAGAFASLFDRRWPTR